MDDYTLQAIQAGLTVYYATREEIDALEQSTYEAVKLTKACKVLQTIRGIGKILGLTIMLETGDIHRFANKGMFSSYCRCVDSTRTSNGKKKGDAKASNKYLFWVFSEAAHFAVRYKPLAQRFYGRKKGQEKWHYRHSARCAKTVSCIESGAKAEP
jgi:transposase